MLPLYVNPNPCTLLSNGTNPNAEFIVALKLSRIKLNATNGGEYVIAFAGNLVKNLAKPKTLFITLGALACSNTSLNNSDFTL